ncbi:MAG: GyrI-like domain-containing protein [Flavobacterium sp.]|nr:GyrI-like domain-containing protein [Flavobacterium sp.]
MKHKKLITGFSFILLLLAVWYLFFKKSDYIITFKTNTSTATVFQGIQDWYKARKAIEQETYTLLEKTNFNNLKFTVKTNTELLEYDWDMKSCNDSVTEVTIGIKDLNNSLYNRLTVPFGSDFKKKETDKVIDFREGLKNHLKNFKVKLEGEGKSEAVFVAYINLKSPLQEKAQTMIMNDYIITGYLMKNGIKIIGKPYVEVVKWDFDNEKLDFNYCFPIEKNTKYIHDEKVKFKTIPAYKGLTATYYGNYRTSDRAWFAIYDYAQKNGISLDYKPLEHFMANPFSGGEEIEWETKIIIPYAKH